MKFEDYTIDMTECGGRIGHSAYEDAQTSADFENFEEYALYWDIFS